MSGWIRALCLVIGLIGSMALSPSSPYACTWGIDPTLYWPDDTTRPLAANSRIWLHVAEPLTSQNFSFTDADGNEVTFDAQIEPNTTSPALLYTLTPTEPLTPGTLYTMTVLQNDPTTWTFTAGPPNTSPPPHIVGGRLYEGFADADISDSCLGDYNTIAQLFLDLERQPTPLRFQLTFTGLQAEADTYMLSWTETPRWPHDGSLRAYLTTGHVPVCVTVTAEDVFGQRSAPWMTCEPTGCEQHVYEPPDGARHTEPGWANATPQACSPAAGRDEAPGCSTATASPQSPPGWLLLAPCAAFWLRRRRKPRS